jgi:hypothetical protein
LTKEIRISRDDCEPPQPMTIHGIAVPGLDELLGPGLEELRRQKATGGVQVSETDATSLLHRAKSRHIDLERIVFTIGGKSYRLVETPAEPACDLANFLTDAAKQETGKTTP